jgi:hypothetical protein
MSRLIGQGDSEEDLVAAFALFDKEVRAAPVPIRSVYELDARAEHRLYLGRRLPTLHDQARCAPPSSLPF